MTAPEQIAHALTTACPDCAQQPGQQCMKLDGTFLAIPHSRRFESADFNDGVRNSSSPTIAAETHQITDANILDTGLLY